MASLGGLHSRVLELSHDIPFPILAILTLWSRFLLRGATQFFTRFSTHFPTPGEVRETRRNLVTGRSSPRLKTMVELVLQSTFRILDESFEYSFSDKVIRPKLS